MSSRAVVFTSVDRFDLMADGTASVAGVGADVVPHKVADPRPVQVNGKLMSGWFEGRSEASPFVVRLVVDDIDVAFGRLWHDPDSHVSFDEIADAALRAHAAGRLKDPRSSQSASA